MTKKDFILIASVLRCTMPIRPLNFCDERERGEYDGKKAQWEETVQSFCRMLANNNPRFKQDVFASACGFSPERIS